MLGQLWVVPLLGGSLGCSYEWCIGMISGF